MPPVLAPLIVVRALNVFYGTPKHPLIMMMGDCNVQVYGAIAHLCHYRSCTCLLAALRVTVAGGLLARFQIE